jgi:hypothetical protein
MGKEMSKFEVWDCKIVVANDAKLPDDFDFPPRCAAIEAVAAAGVEVLDCFSGWGGTLTEIERRIVEETAKRRSRSTKKVNEKKIAKARLDKSKICSR